MIDKLSAGMKSWIKQDYQDICESPADNFQRSFEILRTPYFRASHR